MLCARACFVPSLDVEAIADHVEIIISHSVVFSVRVLSDTQTGADCSLAGVRAAPERPTDRCTGAERVFSGGFIGCLEMFISVWSSYCCMDVKKKRLISLAASHGLLLIGANKEPPRILPP